ncbi:MULTISPECIES: flagellar export protein FliJ [unclassified Paenibacillus]|uniref:flagellar export protein FliJ n=1 Tax=unclassified Paenibacillus TaxID=185978 RepID=UPI0009550FAF|nr:MULTISPECIES: flagellar export protein FliJ [unclassified Paenibacillus]ASS65716.1 flagellar export protein FliJ [Paenibacillus sp. RUD330]SIQ26458.1 flagellar FliJ protein [Paenibacillus sp. RU4X]SIQ48372.1 flagellar FliJ protein [Paenibacillus sp. RU4T]
MTAFRYAYQSIVNLKQSETTQAKWGLTAALDLLHAEEMSLSELNAERLRWEGKLEELGMQGSPLMELQAIQRFLSHLDACIGSKQQVVQAAENEVESSRHRLAERKIQEKIWLKSKEKALNRFKAAQLAGEQAELDEIAVQRHSRAAL